MEELFDLRSDPWEIRKLAATSDDAAENDRLRSALKSDDPVKRNWALLGILLRGKSDDVEPLLEDAHSANRVLAAEVLHAAGEKDTAEKAAELERGITHESQVWPLNAIMRLGLSGNVPDRWTEKPRGRGTRTDTSAG